MQTRALSKQEQEFGEAILGFIAAIEGLQIAAVAVKETGGDPRYALMSVVPDGDKNAVAMQWPILSVLLGV